jgi:hypothetical protein
MGKRERTATARHQEPTTRGPATSPGAKNHFFKLEYREGKKSLSSSQKEILASSYFQRQCPMSYRTLKSLSPRSSERDAVSRL